MTDFGFQKLRAPSLKDHAYEQLKIAIMSGKVKYGQKLTARALAKSMGTSEMPIRVALNRLLAEGALVQIASSGTTVLPDVTKKDLVEWMGLRALLEKRATELAVPNITDAGIVQVEVMVDKMMAAFEQADIDAHLEANFQLKHELYAFAQSPTLMQYIENLWLRVGPFLRAPSVTISPDMISTSRNQSFIKALRSGDGGKASKIIQKDIEDTLRILLKTAEFAAD